MNEKLQILILRVIEKMLPILTDPQLHEVVSSLTAKLSECSNVTSRYKICEILIAAHKILKGKAPAVAKDLHNALLSGQRLSSKNVFFGSGLVLHNIRLQFSGKKVFFSSNVSDVRMFRIVPCLGKSKSVGLLLVHGEIA